MTRDFAQVIGIGEFLVQHSQLAGRKPDFGKQPRAPSSIVIEHGQRFASTLAEPARDHQGSEMIPRRHVPFAGADENAGALFDGPGKVPARIIDRIRRRNESDALRSTHRPIQIRGFRCGRETGIRFFHNANEAREPRRVLQLIGDLMKADLFQRYGNEPADRLQRVHRALRRTEIAAE